MDAYYKRASFRAVRNYSNLTRRVQFSRSGRGERSLVIEI